MLVFGSSIEVNVLASVRSNPSEGSFKHVKKPLNILWGKKEANVSQARIIKKVMDIFGSASGHNVNSKKTEGFHVSGAGLECLTDD
ncbi:uncharacterized protein LOC128035608 isoform X2 [Gossypium raimondii]|uniref:uncharacterized protein LOC128035608 isoform X2 n=1 Tax=Gossypium raimondii TaxID=29730 RepID=UPI00227D624A|nr:uncharacterized protein LOC128035608 isoform X2 [Gossypium raimondii]